MFKNMYTKCHCSDMFFNTFMIGEMSVNFKITSLYTF